MKNSQSEGQIFGFHKIYIYDNGKEAIIKRGCSDFFGGLKMKPWNETIIYKYSNET